MGDWFDCFWLVAQVTVSTR